MCSEIDETLRSIEGYKSQLDDQMYWKKFSPSEMPIYCGVTGGPGCGTHAVVFAGENHLRYSGVPFISEIDILRSLPECLLKEEARKSGAISHPLSAENVLLTIDASRAYNLEVLKQLRFVPTLISTKEYKGTFTIFLLSNHKFYTDLLNRVKQIEIGGVSLYQHLYEAPSVSSIIYEFQKNGAVGVLWELTKLIIDEYQSMPVDLRSVLNSLAIPITFVASQAVVHSKQNMRTSYVERAEPRYYKDVWNDGDLILVRLLDLFFVNLAPDKFVEINPYVPIVDQFSTRFTDYGGYWSKFCLAYARQLLQKKFEGSIMDRLCKDTSNLSEVVCPGCGGGNVLFSNFTRRCTNCGAQLEVGDFIV